VTRVMMHKGDMVRSMPPSHVMRFADVTPVVVEAAVGELGLTKLPKPGEHIKLVIPGLGNKVLKPKIGAVLPALNPITRSATLRIELPNADRSIKLGLSVEIRREKGEKYFPLNGILRQFELMYVIGDERDLIKQCTDVYLNGVYVYPSRLTREEGRALFVDVMRRANQLAIRPEFYNTFTNNCTTNLVRHINRLGTRKLPYNHQVIFPGQFDELLYDKALIASDVSFAQARLRARINRFAYLHADSPEYSARLRH